MIGHLDRLTGWTAILHVARNGGQLNKYADWYEGQIEDIDLGYAQEVASEDPSLIWCDVAKEIRA